MADLTTKTLRVSGISKPDLVAICKNQKAAGVEKVDPRALSDYLKQRGRAFVSPELDGIYPTLGAVTDALVRGKVSLYHPVYEVREIDGQIKVYDLHNVRSRAVFGIIGKSAKPSSNR